MLVANFITGTEVPANTNIPLVAVKNTNNRTQVNSANNTISFYKTGLYDLNAILVVTDVAAGNVTAQLYRDGVAVPGATASATSAATTDLITLPLQDAFAVINAMCGSLANVSIQCDVAVTPTGGNVIVEFER